MRPGAAIHAIAGEPIELARVERALVTVAYIVALHGEHYAPLFDRLEREVEEMKSRPSATARARAVLERYTVDGGVKAIR